MHTFAVWAPAARRVDVHVHTPGSDGAAATALQRDAARAGWWRADVEGAGHGTDHSFSVDGGEPRPDPRSAWQPHGVHGPSRVFDAARHAWGDTAWAGRDVRGAVLYELHVGTFTPEGTLDAAAAHLGHLVDLGVDVVELMPVAAFPGRWGWGYDGVDLYAVHEAYGGPEALQRFVDAAHGLGLAVALDVVYNHLGPSGNYLAEFGPYFTAAHETPWGAAVNLDDEGSEEVRRFVVDNALRWFSDFHVDALRLDAVHALVDDSPTHLLAQLAAEVGELSARLGRPLGLVAESDLNDPAMVTPLGRPTGSRRQAMGMQAQWADDVHHALRALLTGERQGYYADFGRPEAVATTLAGVFLHAGGYSSFRGTEWGAPVDTSGRSGYDGHAFVAYTTTHDQTGNRAAGDRMSASLDDAQLASAQAVVMTSAFTPMVFMGEEWGARTPWMFFTDHDPELGRLVSEGRAREFGEHGWSAEQVPDPQDPGTRHASVLDWSEPTTERGARLLAWTRELVALRRVEPDVASGALAEVAVTTSEEGAGAEGWLVVARGATRLVVNLAGAAQAVPVPGAGVTTEVLAAWDGAEVADGSVTLPAHCPAVLRVTPG